MNFYSSIPQAFDEFKKGKMIIAVDSLNRENQGDLIFPAQTVTPEKINFMMKECRGLVCVAITKEKAVQLELPLMVESIDNTEKTKVNFTISVDTKDVESFGISAGDKTKTIELITSSYVEPKDLVRPGHVFPLVAADNGLLERQGHTEAAIELSRLSGFAPCGVLCEILTDEGNVASMPDLLKFSQKFNLKIVTIADLLNYIKIYPTQNNISTASIVKKATAQLPTEFGTFQITIYKSILDDREHAVLLMGKRLKEPVVTRIQSQCLTGDTFLSLKCDCRKQLHQSMKMIQQKKLGIIIYLNQEGRGIGLTNKIKAYNLQEKGLDTVEANHALGLPIDARDYKIAAEILKDLGVSKIILLTNNPQKIKQLSDNGISILAYRRIESPPNKINRHYLLTKKNKLGHYLTVV